MILDLGKGRDRRTGPPEIEHPAPSFADEVGGPNHQLLQHRLEPPPLGRVAYRGEFAGQSQLANEPQAVVGEHAQMQDEVVAVELAAGAAARESRVGATPRRALDDLHGRLREAGPPPSKVYSGSSRRWPLLSTVR